MKEILKDRSFRLSVMLTFIFLATGVVFLVLGLAELGWVLFVLLPIVLGISIGVLPNKKLTIFGAVIATVLSLYGMYLLGISGLLCGILALPIIIPVIFLGAIAAHAIKRRRQIKSNENFPFLLIPLIPFLILAPIEQYLTPKPRAEVAVKTEKVFNASPEEVYDAIKSVDTLNAERTFLMYLDLPIPTKCVLEKEEIGALRICYFKPGNMSNADFGGGTITEKITELERGRILKMDVIEYTLIGREWLGFKEAIYYFEKAEGGRCKMTRITTYTSVLAPRFYWEPLERLGIEQEHEFVFRNLEKDLKKDFHRAVMSP